MAFDYSPVTALKFRVNYSFIHMREPLPATPEHNLFLSGAYQLRHFHFSLTLQNIYNLYNETPGGVEVVETAYHVLDARIGYRATKYLYFYVSGHNLLNEDYQINYGYPMPGTTLSAGINLKLSGNKEKRPN